MMLNAVIIEDIPENRETLKKLIYKDFPQIRIVGETGSVVTGYETIIRQKPELVFFDIQLSDGTCFDILMRLQAQQAIDFGIIFITAHGTFEYATKAIEYSALDFITKPIDNQKLKKAINKAEAKLSHPAYSEQISLLLENLSPTNHKSKRIAIHLIKGVIEFIHVEHIIYLEADGTMTDVHLKDGQQLKAAKHLGNYSTLLINDYSFFAISNSLVINLDYVKRYTHNDLTITLTNGTILYASRRRGQDFKKFLNGDKKYGNLQSGRIYAFLKDWLGK